MHAAYVVEEGRRTPRPDPPNTRTAHTARTVAVVVDVGAVVGRTGAANVDANVDVAPDAVPASVEEDTKPQPRANTYLDVDEAAVGEACKCPEGAGAGNDVNVSANVDVDVVNESVQGHVQT